MIGTQPGRLNFSPALGCVDCQQPTNQGLIYQMGSQVWQLLPLCTSHIEDPSGSTEPISLGALRRRINEQLAVIEHFQRRKHHMARSYARLRRHHVPPEMLRSLRWKLNQVEKLQAEVMEVLP